MDKVSEKLTVFFEEPFGVGMFELYQRESYLCVRLRLVQSQKTMRYTTSF